MTLTVLEQHPAFFFSVNSRIHNYHCDWSLIDFVGCKSLSLFLYIPCVQFILTLISLQEVGAKVQYNHNVISHQGSPLCLSVLPPRRCATSQACCQGTGALLSKGEWYRETLNKGRTRGQKLLAQKNSWKSGQYYNKCLSAFDWLREQELWRNKAKCMTTSVLVIFIEKW